MVFSSRERSGPETIGEATMMTQMGWTVIENSAIAEVGILRMADFKMVFLAQGSWTVSLEQLDVPIGSNQPSPTDAREISEGPIRSTRSGPGIGPFRVGLSEWSVRTVRSYR